MFCKEFPFAEGRSQFVGFGGFVRATKSSLLRLQLTCGSSTANQSFDLGSQWARIGLAIQAPPDGTATCKATIEWDGSIDLSVWGFELDLLTLPKEISEENRTLEILNSTHLCPETFYLDHEHSIDLDIDAEASSPFHLDKGNEITVKKCSYCQRLLPLNPTSKGLLSFHKHNAKLTKHQNECRACKKWRINDSFNPLRTTDQLHESSVITRERKILLREPEILQEIKDRTGAGLKSQIWERFDRRCFYCGIPVDLDDFQLDHTRPLAYLWPIDEHATCLCSSHNNLKKDKFPVDFYNTDQLKRLSVITGLSYKQLLVKDVNETELNRIISDIRTFSKQWDPRTFYAIARKISEIRPNIDLFGILKLADERLHLELMRELEERPPSVGNDALDLE